MRRALRSLLLLAAAALPACREATVTGPGTTTLPRPLTAGEQNLVAASNAFAFKLYTAMAAREGPDTNIFISPLSVGMALGMTVNGAAGATRDSMLAALQLAGVPMDVVNQGYRSVIDLLRHLDPGVAFTLANSIWYRTGFTPSQAFLGDARTYFDAQVQGLDFSSSSAAPTINAWVNAQTNGKIPSIVQDPIDPSLIMFLINAIYFKGSWTQRFDSTRDAPFYPRTGVPITVAMMEHDSAGPVGLYSGDDATVVDLPYGGRAWSMTIVLPRGAWTDSLATMLTASRWSAWIAGLDSQKAYVSLPKFKLTFERELEAPLAALGMGIAFCDVGFADFSAMYPGARPGGVCISFVKHKTYVDVNEEGTEAAAVTSVGMGVGSMPAGPPHIVVDRPFIVAIRERLTGTILFLGRVMDPAS